MILALDGGKYLHTAYAVSNIPEEFAQDDWSLTSQEGMAYIGTYIDSSSAEGTDPTKYSWDELLDTEVNDTDDDGLMPVADLQAQIDALQDQINILQGAKDELQTTISNQAVNIASASDLGTNAQDVASAAKDIASATSQYFWTDTNGVHISNEEANADGDRNTIFNTLGMLFRKGANNLLAILAGGASGTDPKGIAIYDGAGNNDSNIVASFTDQGAVIGKQGDARTIIDATHISMVNPDGVEQFAIKSTGQQFTQGVLEYYPQGIYAGATNTITLFTKGQPANGTSFEVETTTQNSGYMAVFFTVGTSQTETKQDSGATYTWVYDGVNTLTVTVSISDPQYDLNPPQSYYEITGDASYYTLGSRQNGQDAGPFSFTSGQGLVAKHQYHTLFGRYNDYTNSSGTEILGVGYGSSDNDRATILSLNQSGDFKVRRNLEYGEGPITGAQSTNYRTELTIGKTMIQTGSVTINVASANTNTDKVVGFGHTYKYTPAIQLTMLNIGGSYYQRCTAAGPSTTGFTCRIRAGGTPGDITVVWVAIGELA